MIESFGDGARGAEYDLVCPPFVPLRELISTTATSCFSTVRDEPCLFCGSEWSGVVKAIRC